MVYIVGIYWVYISFKGLQQGGFKQLGYPKNPQKIDLHLSWGGTYRKGLPVAELGVYTLPADGRPAKPTLPDGNGEKTPQKTRGYKLGSAE